MKTLLNYLKKRNDRKNMKMAKEIYCEMLMICARRHMSVQCACQDINNSINELFELENKYKDMRTDTPLSYIQECRAQKAHRERVELRRKATAALADHSGGWPDPITPARLTQYILTGEHFYPHDKCQEA